MEGNHLRVAVLPGDGIGPEVTRQATRVSRAAARRFGLHVELREGLIGGAALEACGESLPPQTLSLVEECHAVLLGAVGGPQWDGLPQSARPEGALLALRRRMDLFANLRPVRAPAWLRGASPLRPERFGQGFDLLIVREIGGGLYFGLPRERTVLPGGGCRAVDTMVYTSGEIERVARVAFEAARARKGKVVSVDKANVLETSRLWREVVERVHRDYRDVLLNHQYVDACAMKMVLDPHSFDVILTENSFGDILSDLAGGLVGSLGLLPSASLGGGGRALYEPVHGSAPDIGGSGTANPLGAILSVALMLRHSLGSEEAARAVERAVDAVMMQGYATPDLMVEGRRRVGTDEMGTLVVRELAAGEV